MKLKSGELDLLLSRKLSAIIDPSYAVAVESGTSTLSTSIRKDRVVLGYGSPLSATDGSNWVDSSLR
ncbi:hypothetical protein PGT21_006093 [Puccinia graminis f. sp. tritici]|uniref:Uncharacterized protein n=1 Tax=Puccinia graminis f. sp. tritici TaxID=56615 RepID=A0A5B0QHI1_PUCGR|nr:hypothetical protein PGT21_006093 [Puccinia graminis f. sp. tritici]